MNISGTSKVWFSVLVFEVLLPLCMAPMVFSAQETIYAETETIKRLELTSGKSIVLKSKKAIKRVSIANPDIADFVLISPREVYISGKSQGLTNLTLWHNGKVLGIYDLDVSYDISRLKQKINSMLPDEKNIRIISSGESISLSGRISSSKNLSVAMSLAEAFAPEGKVHNLLEVAGVQQVMLEVRIAEMSKNLTRRLGVNFNYSRGEEFGVGLLRNLATLVTPEDATVLQGPYGPNGSPWTRELGFLVSPTVDALFRFQQGSATWTGFIDALKGEGLIKVLAEPTLVAQSGQTANFLAGGEYPYPVPQGLGTVGIEYKPYGVGLSFTPTVLDEGKISINVSPEVSELDFSNAISLEGYTVPGLLTRRTSTVVELKDGQSFAIAGLLKESVLENIERYPFLGDIPVLGALFQSRSFLKKETELVIIVTPHLVKPLNAAEQTLPTDFYIEPDDIEFYIWGLKEGRKNKKQSPIEGQMDGDFGHAIPIS